MANEFKLTKERVDQIANELEYLKTVREHEVAEMIKEARSFGDLSENSEYDEAKNEQGKLYSRIAELENILANAVIIEAEHVDEDAVHHGCTVKVKDMEDGFEEEFEIVGSQEADPAVGRISDESPIGKALMGHKAGDEVVVNAPAGEIRYTIVEVKKANK